MSSAITELQSILETGDMEFVEQFVAKRARTSMNSAAAYKSAVIRFLAYIGKSTIIDITRNDAEEYLSALDQMVTKKKDRSTGAIKYFPVTLAYKRTQLHLVNTFFEQFTDYIYEKDRTYRSPIPAPRRYQFTPDETPSHAEIQQKIQDAHFTPEKALEILKHLYYEASGKYIRGGDKEYFLIALLQTVCGMRISETVATKIEDVNIQERFLITARVKGARKNNKTGGKPLYFCFPDEVAYILNEYIRDLQKKCPTTKWLFPGDNASSHVITRSVEFALEGLEFDVPLRTHSFRKTIEYLQADINKVPLHFVEMLSNHTITSVVMKHYAEAPIETRRAIYDEYFPPQFKPILAWIATL